MLQAQYYVLRHVDAGQPGKLLVDDGGTEAGPAPGEADESSVVLPSCLLGVAGFMHDADRHQLPAEDPSCCGVCGEHGGISAAWYIHII